MTLERRRSARRRPTLPPTHSSHTQATRAPAHRAAGGCRIGLPRYISTYKSLGLARWSLGISNFRHLEVVDEHGRGAHALMMG